MVVPLDQSDKRTTKLKVAVVNNMETQMFTKLAIGLTLAGAGVAHAAYPDQPVTVVVPFPAGGGVDVLMRQVAAALSEKWHQPVIVLNKVGAGSTIGATFVARARPDGYTLLATVNQTMTGNRYLYRSLAYDPDRSFAPITMMVKSDQLVVANPQLPVHSLAELVKLARSKNGIALNYGSYGNGSLPHLLFGTLNHREHIAIAHIPYNGIAPSVTALLGGEVQVGLGSSAVLNPFIQAGRLRPLAVTGDKRLPGYPNVPTVAEQGFPYARMSIWYGLFAPRDTPPAIVKEVGDQVRAILKDPTFAARHLTPTGLQLVANSGSELASAIQAESKSTEEMVKAAGIVPE
jgi:tripartite-type tricarboxylate transporter receptor subunit TctC